MNASIRIGGAFIVTCAGCALAVPVLLEKGGLPTDLSAPETWRAFAGFAGAFLGAVTGILSLTKRDQPPLTPEQTTRTVSNAMFREGVATKADIKGVATKADIDAAVAKLLAANEQSEAAPNPPPLDQLRGALEALASSHVAAKTNAFDLIEQGKVDDGLATLEAFAEQQSGLLTAAADQTADTWRQLGYLSLATNVAKAAHSFERAEQVSPGDFSTLMELFGLYLSLGRIYSAHELCAALSRVAVDDRQRSIALYAQGDVLIEQGKPDQALARYEESLPIAEALAQIDVGNFRFASDLDITRRRIAELKAEVASRDS
ncbi:hypothetical protein [Brevundimonas sp.]|uniref:hypothetical protein n=1 Tax=Brevundimonas sp. TaxID=1871086 RepID=UPI00391980E6